jgi:iron complex transport system substrate-binding protein
MLRRKIGFILLMLVLILSLIYSKEIKNLDGISIIVPDKVEKVAALFGPSYEKVFLLGAEDKIIADGDFHINGWPWSNLIYKKLEKVNGIKNAHVELNIEEVLKLNPDVVFYWDKPKEIQKLKDIGISSIPAVFTGKLDDTKNLLMVYAQVLGNSEEKIAQKYSKYFDEKVRFIKSITDKIPENKRPKVYMANQEILWTYCKTSDIPELFSIAGGICVHKDIEGNSKAEISYEQLIKWNPEYIFVDHAGSSGNAAAEDIIKKASGDGRLNDIEAFKKENVIINPTGVFFWDSGVQKILLLMFVAKTIHPDYFKSLDMKKEVKYFYKEFFRYNLTDSQAEKILKHENP